jgi:hypothetical protein
MTTAYTSLLGLALPVTGELEGTWGDVVNQQLTELLDAAIAGTTTLSIDADVTLTTTSGAANQAREAILLWTASGTATRYITAPAQSKAYIVVNKTGSTQSIVIRGVGPTTGVTVLANRQTIVVWNGSDFVEVASGDVVGPASSTNDAFARFDGTTGKLLQNSTATLTDAGAATFIGSVGISGTSASAADLKLYEDTDTGTNYVGLKAPSSIASDVTWTLPNVDGTNGQALVTNGTGDLSWTTITSGASISNDTSTATNLYPAFLGATTGSALNIYTSNAKLLYKPSTGDFQASQLIASNGLVLNSTTIAASYTVPSGSNAMSVGPVTIASGESVTVTSGQRWVVL